jgi:3-oxoacyl-[acyl-carrier-protein] synthase-3
MSTSDSSVFHRQNPGYSHENFEFEFGVLQNRANESVFIRGLGKFLPGKPIANDEMENVLGCVAGKPSALRKRVLQRNGIVTRYYAIDADGRSQFSNAEMAAEACRAAVQNSGAELTQIQLLASATTQGDLLVPGFASMVHGELKNPPCEIASLGGVCASSLLAIKHVAAQIATGEISCGIACASEMPSRLFKASRYDAQSKVRDQQGRLDFDTEFLRWMLSDGAGAALLAATPHPTQPSFRIDWIKLRSYADTQAVCMYSGANGPGERTWLDLPDFTTAAEAGLLNLKQDVNRLDDLVKVGMSYFIELIEQKLIDPERIDWLLAHYSSEKFRTDILMQLARLEISIPPERWFSNLSTVGNTGSASILLMLEEFARTAPLVEGQKILCMVPESGRFSVGFMQLTVVLPRKGRAVAQDQSRSADQPIPPSTHEFAVGRGELARGLAKVWLDFDLSLARVPIVEAVVNGAITREGYAKLLLNWRQQVVEGGRWIARAASSIDSENAELRSLFIQHAKEEHLDFKLLDKAYAHLGRDVDDIRRFPPNVGSEALSAFVMYRASQPNPFDLIGTMFIIEGLGRHKAAAWGRRIKECLQLEEEAVEFFLYHGSNDEDHLAKLEVALAGIELSDSLVRRIIRTAEVTARLYRLQLEEISV